ncbi:hypothetical protein [Planctomicrobium sp. SH664]|uniref:hypothetical protein n=1 Tax=Planctomicrobium sp. SH664 TaxID=3448125 RepID=UPI003F5C11C9
MRLTLRTLLAYLDDALEPAEAREIGEKLAESKEAAQLVTRIRDVIRRRRIGAPELAGPGSGPDPNLVADYIENTLPPAQVVELEKLCQKSDMHLAEVAACHKILTMVISQPLDVPDDVRERMYALGGAGKREEGQEGAAVMPPMAEGMGQTLEGHTLKDGLPEYLTRSDYSKKFWVTAGMITVGALWLAIVITDRSLWQRSEGVAKTTPQPVEPVNPQPAPTENPAVANAPAVGVNAPAVVVTSPARASAQPANPAPVANATVPPPLPAWHPDHPEAVPAGSASPMPATPIVNGEPLPATEAVVPAVVPALPEVDMNYSGGDEIVLQRLTPNAPWRIVDAQTSIHVGDEIATPVPYRNEYQLDGIGKLSVEPGTRLKRLPRSSADAVAFQLNRGRVIVSLADAGDSLPAIQFTVANRAWTVTPMEPGTRYGIEYHLPVPEGLPGHAVNLETTGGLAVAAGRIRVQTDGTEPVELSAEDGLAVWPAPGSALVKDAELSVPQWLHPDGLFVTPSARNLARIYQKEFISDRSVIQSIGPVVKDRRANVSDLAVQTMSLIDQYQELVPALAAEHGETRIAAIQGLRAWLLVDPNNGSLLKEELGKSFRAEAADSLLRLLWGFDTQDGRNQAVSAQLVDWLKSDEIAIREAAFFQLVQLTARRYDYLPMAPVMERKAAISRWEEHLRRNGGSLIPN